VELAEDVGGGGGGEARVLAVVAGLRLEVGVGVGRERGWAARAAGPLVMATRLHAGPSCG